MPTCRHRVLPGRGTLFVNTDVHGNLDDFRAVEELFRAASTRAADVHWVILGDVVHAPDDETRKSHPTLYDYDDGSLVIVERIVELQRAFPDRVHFVLGNHDHGHVGGPHTAKFHRDEVTALEAKLSTEERRLLHHLFAPALLLVAAPCGVLLCHGSPDTALTSLAMLDDVELDIRKIDLARSRALRTVLTSYGQPAETTNTMLANVSRSAALDLRVVIHGHDTSESGFFHECGNQVCPVLFGAPKAEKRYVRLDLAARYKRAEEIRDGFELRRLYLFSPPQVD